MLESLSSEELQFIKAIEKYKAESGRIFLSWTEVLKILKQLGYRKVLRKAAGATSREESTQGAPVSRSRRPAKACARPTRGSAAVDERVEEDETVSEPTR